MLEIVSVATQIAISVVIGTWPCLSGERLCIQIYIDSEMQGLERSLNALSLILSTFFHDRAPCIVAVYNQERRAGPDSSGLD
jgi:hypothetical protein